MSQAEDPLEQLELEHRQRPASRVEFRAQLDACDHLLVEVASLVASAIVPVTTAFLQADRYAASEHIAGSAQIQRRCVELEDAGYLLLARQSPVAGDLRRTVAVLRCAREVQRSDHLLKHIAQSLTWVHPPSMPDRLRQVISQFGAVSSEIFHSGIESWRRHDGLAAPELKTRDDQVDLLQKVLLTELYTGQQSVEESVSLALISRYYERIADHGVELARQVAYFVTGDRVER
ncbi:MAG: phosphate signaling complex PhoU family protein [Egibacteraceae bacterium]